MMDNPLMLGLVLGWGLALSACSIDPQQAYSVYQPSSLPVRNVTRFDDALQCFDGLLTQAQLKPIYITAEGIPNQAGNDTAITSGRTMLVTTVLQLHSDVFRFIDLPSLVDSQLLELQGIYKSSPFLVDQYLKKYREWNNGSLPKAMIYPDYTITGGITQSDKSVIANGAGASVTLDNGDVGVSKDDMASVITMDMSVKDNANFEVLFSVANSIAVERQGMSGDLGGRIKKAGVYLNFSFDKSEGTHQAIRTLVQLNTLEVLGQLAHVPYQQCLPTGMARAEKPVLAAAVVPKAKPVQITLTPSKSVYQLNDVLQFQLQADTTVHVRCFFQNYQGKIWQIFPNQVQTNDVVAAHQSVLIPEQNPAFEIGLDTAGVTEQVLCLASPQTWAQSDAPQALKVLPQPSLDAVLGAYQVAHDGPLAQQMLSVETR